MSGWPADKNSGDRREDRESPVHYLGLQLHSVLTTTSVETRHRECEHCPYIFTFRQCNIYNQGKYNECILFIQHFCHEHKKLLRQ